jgi:type I restriction enzyme, S subunit
MTSNETCLGNFYPVKGGSVDPSKHSDETFELFSIPAYDRGETDILPGSEIGSSKKLFQPNDVLLSRIVPHIRRCWIVPEGKDLRQIGSGEWIVFRSQHIYPEFLRYYLLSDSFHSKFMSTVKGIGGSLLRADPKQVAKFKIPLPPLEEQKQIAAILDAADELRQKDKALITKYDELTQSLFLDMFGDPLTNSKGWEVDLLRDVTEIDMGQSPRGSSYNTVAEGLPLLNGPTEFGEITPIEKQWTSEPKKLCKNEDILFCVRGATAGRMNWADKKYCIGRGLAAIRSKGDVSAQYIYMILKMMYDTFQRTSDGSTFINISKADLGNVKIPKTSPAFQSAFSKRILNIEKQKIYINNSLMRSEALFNCLLQKAFKGEFTN